MTASVLPLEVRLATDNAALHEQLAAKQAEITAIDAALAVLDDAPDPHVREVVAFIRERRAAAVRTTQVYGRGA